VVWNRGRPQQRGPGETENVGFGNLPVRAILPGLIVVIFYNLYGSFYPGNVPGIASTVNTALLLILPWITIILFDRGSSALGVSRRALLINICWGTLAGVSWRASSLLLNLALLQLSGVEASRWVWLQAIVFVPWVEEIFFRGYLGLTLSDRCGRGWANLFQAVLFTLQPSHLAQGFPGLISIFIFGLGAGWLVQRRGSVCIGVAAHAAANALLWALVGFA